MLTLLPSTHFSSLSLKVADRALWSFLYESWSQHSFQFSLRGCLPSSEINEQRNSLAHSLSSFLLSSPAALPLCNECSAQRDLLLPERGNTLTRCPQNQPVCLEFRSFPIMPVCLHLYTSLHTFLFLAHCLFVHASHCLSADLNWFDHGFCICIYIVKTSLLNMFMLIRKIRFDLIYWGWKYYCIRFHYLYVFNTQYWMAMWSSCC